MNKKELINFVSKITCVPKKDVDLITQSLLETVILTVSNGEVVRLVGFGSFYAYTKKQKYIPHTVKGIKFIAGKFFKKNIHNNI
jgi:DNA-binding protein HU-beta